MIISWAGQKGGAGKSTLAIALATELHRLGYSTLLVDADPQGTASTWGDVAAELAEDVPDYTYPTVVAMGSNLHKQLPALASNYDFTVIDCPGRIDERQRAALAIADLALVPVTPDTSDVWALSESLELINQAQVFRPELAAFLVLNKLRASTAEAHSAREIFAPAGLPILDAELGYRVAFGRFAHEGVGVVEFEPGGKAAEEIKALTREVLTIKDKK